MIKEYHKTRKKKLRKIISYLLAKSMQVAIKRINITKL